jgi:hypothetical protein
MLCIQIKPMVEGQPKAMASMNRAA